MDAFREQIHRFACGDGELKDVLTEVDRRIAAAPDDEKTLLDVLEGAAELRSDDRTVIERHIRVASERTSMDERRAVTPSSDVIFKESGLVTRNTSAQRHRAALSWGAYGALGAASVLGVALLLVSFFGNRALIDDVSARATAIAEAHRAALDSAGSFPQLLKALEALRTLPGATREDEDAPLRLSFGLCQGDKLAEAAELAYHRALSQRFVPVLMNRLQQQAAENRQNPEAVYQTLKTYLMFATPEKRDPELMRLWISEDWATLHPGAANASFRERFQNHLSALLSGSIEPTPQADAMFVDDARRTLLQFPLGARIYSEAKVQAAAQPGPLWTLANQVPANALALFRRKSGQPVTAGVPHFYTVDGYLESFAPRVDAIANDALGESWVLGPDYGRAQGGAADFRREAEELYVNDYIKVWDGLLDDLTLRSAANVEQVIDLLRATAQPDSPIKATLGAIASQTRLSQSVRDAEAKRQTPVPGQIEQLRQKVQSLVQSVRPSAAQADVADPTARVDQHFAALNALFPGDGKGGPLDALGPPLTSAADALVANQTLGGLRAASAQLYRVARAQPPGPLKEVTQELADAAAGRVPVKERDEANKLQEAWSTTVYPACRDALSDRYPFSRTSPTDANLADVARILGPNGLIDQFSQTYVKPLADTAVRPWRLVDASAAGMSARSLAMFEQAASIRQGLFPSGATQPQTSFEIEPLELTNAARRVQLDIGGQTLTYEHGPRRPIKVQWPPATGGASARLVFTPLDNPGANVGVAKAGPWALFRLLDTARIDAEPSGDRFRVVFSIDGYDASFRLIADSVQNPFQLRELSQFRCLPQL